MARISFKYRLILLLGLVCVFTITYFSIFSKEDEPNVSVILRYDDYASESSTNIEKEILKAVKEYDLSCSFGIIPFSQTISNSNDKVFVPLVSSKIEMIYDMVQDGSIEVCQLGYSHSGIKDGESLTEFKGLPLNRQLDKIASAKIVLDTAFGIKTRTFIPPWNSYDQSTVEALLKLEFKNISGDNKETGIDHGNLGIIPFTANASDLESVVDLKSLPFDGQNATLVWMLNDVDFQEVNSINGFTNIDKFKSLMSQLIEQDWKIISIEKALSQFDIFDLQYYKLNGIKLSLVNHLSPLANFPLLFNKLGILSSFYLSAGQINRLLLMTVVYYLCLLLVVIELVILLFRWISMESSFRKILLYLPLLVVLILAAFFWFDDHTYGKNELILILLFIGLFLGKLPGKRVTD